MKTDQQLEDMDLESLLELLPGRNKYWKIPGKWSNDWWFNIDQTWVRDDNGKYVLGFSINYYGDNRETKLLDSGIFGKPREVAIKMYKHLRDYGLLDRPYEYKYEMESITKL
jgi:hypothetical protein